MVLFQSSTLTSMGHAISAVEEVLSFGPGVSNSLAIIAALLDSGAEYLWAIYMQFYMLCLCYLCYWYVIYYIMLFLCHWYVICNIIYIMCSMLFLCY
jgi:hypothetical protein